jgi:formiminotetrahydrofolate cyclodeaminase
MEKPNFSRWTLGGFVEQLGEGSPLPGGGCAVSLTGALAAALGSLAAQIIAKRPGKADPGALGALLHGLQKHRAAFLECIDADALAYQEVVQARRLPRQSREDAVRRQAAIDAAYLQACEPPRQMARQGLEVLRGALELAGHRNPVVLADIGVMGFLAIAVVHGGLVNIFSNLGMVPDSEPKRNLLEEGLRLRTEVETLRPQFLTAVAHELKVGDS